MGRGWQGCGAAALSRAVEVGTQEWQAVECCSWLSSWVRQRVGEARAAAFLTGWPAEPSEGRRDGVPGGRGGQRAAAGALYCAG